MTKMRRRNWYLTLATMMAMLAGLGSAAPDCPRKDALGTARVMSVDAKTTPRGGLKSFAQTLLDESRDLTVVLHHENLHETTLSAPR